MPRKILIKTNGLTGTETVPVGYKFVGFENNNFSEKTLDTITPISGGGLSYNVYTAILTQSGTDAPVATVLENTLSGPLGWSYSSTGIYRATLAGEFSNSNKVVVFINQAGGFYALGSGSTIFTNAYVYDNDQIEVITTLDSSLSNGMWLVTPIEIRVYP